MAKLIGKIMDAMVNAMWILFFGTIAVIVLAAIFMPDLTGPRKNSNDTAAIGALKTIGTAQSLFREADKEQDGNLDYGTLSELSNSGTTGLIDSVLGSGTKNGYLYECSYSTTSPKLMWFATARPALPGKTGERYYATNHEGVTYYTTTQAFSLNTTDCTMPPGVQPVGR